MCGVVGLYQHDGAPVSQDVLRRMTDLLTHRGPDGEGFWTQGPIGLGHRRLAILDLSDRGANPMCANDTRIRITYNGELYNMRELRRELEAKGYHFRTETDTEVVVNMYQEYGTEALGRFNGMFAFVLWDGRRNRMVLARDRFGVKPLYYAQIGATLLAASEIKAFLGDARFQPEPDLIGISQQLSFMGLLGGQTVFRGVKLLEPGHMLICDAEGTRDQTFWRLHPEPENRVEEAVWEDRIDAAFSASVGRQMQSDVPLSTYLSGGIDTSAITSTALEFQSELHTFTCGFELPQDARGFEQFFDETSASRETSDLFGTIHHELKLGPQDMPDALDSIAWHLEEPRAGICYQNFLTAQMISRDAGLKVVLSGLGGDELFGGYHWRIGAAADLPAQGFEDGYYQQACRLLSDETKAGLLSSDVLAELGAYTPRAQFDQILRQSAHLSSGERALHFEFYTFLQSLLLVEDKLSMAHSLEGRVPFLDNDLVDIAFRIPFANKLKDGQGKAILRTAMARRLPPQVINRRKQGFTPPDRTWYRTVNRDFLYDRLLASDGVLSDLLRRDALERMLGEHMDETADHRFVIWSLLMYQASFAAFRAHRA